ncbi:hypothetical protein NDU88_004244 [Pleurodeles waltl]|uniref:Uncharacterized protein n=1 Tax=Pleurodeles waltl TaxID=8319 RepID=A0AAV7LJA1_PLEWA|nr:hypothetical protein NDU88_004244 [Pleurodeles waltl]
MLACRLGWEKEDRRRGSGTSHGAAKGSGAAHLVRSGCPRAEKRNTETSKGKGNQTTEKSRKEDLLARAAPEFPSWKDRPLVAAVAGPQAETQP